MDIYSMLAGKMTGFNENYDDCIQELNQALVKLNECIVVNNTNYFKNNIQNVINDMRRDADFIRDYIIPEARNR